MPRTEDADRLKTFLAQNPDHPQAPELRRRIEELEARHALADGSPYALRAYLNRYPASASAFEVRQKLEQLDWQKASAADGEKDYRSFLTDWPAGVFAENARQRLAGKRCERLLTEGRLEDLEGAARSERLPCREQLRQRALELRYLIAADAPCCGELLRFLRRYGASAPGLKLRRLLAGWRVEELLLAARFDLAREIAQQYALAQDVFSRINQARDSWQAALKHAEPALLEDFREPPGAPFPPDACRRRLLARELAAIIDEGAASTLFELTDDAYLEVRREAVFGLRRVLDNLGRARAAGWLFDRFSRMDEAAAAPLQVAILRWLAGENEEALSLLRAVSGESAYGNVFALWLSAIMAGEIVGRRIPTLAVDFQRAAFAFASGRMSAWEQDQTRDKKAATSILRQLCALARLWREAAPESAENSLAGDPPRADSLTLSRLEQWLAEREKAAEWPDQQTCGGCLVDAKPAESGWALTPQAVVRLALFPTPGIGPLLDRIACCHPREQLRHIARNIRIAAAVLESVGVHWPLWVAAAF